MIQTKCRKKTEVELSVSLVAPGEIAGKITDSEVMQLSKRVVELRRLQMESQWVVANMEVTYNPKDRTGVIVNDSYKAYKVLLEMWDRSLINMQEQFCALFLDRKNKVIGFRMLNIGSVTACTIDVHMIYAMALACRATGVVIAHNHPSGQMVPSIADLSMTSNINAGLKLLDINLIDSLIISETQFYSFADKGKIY